MTQIEDKAQSILKHGLMLAEETDELVNNYSGREVEEVMVKKAQEMINNSDDPERTKRIIGLTVNLGQRFNSEAMLNFAKTAKEKWEAKYGQ